MAIGYSDIVKGSSFSVLRKKDRRTLKAAESEKLLVVNASGLLEVETPSEPDEPERDGDHPREP